MKANIIMLIVGIVFALVALYAIYRIVKKKEAYMTIIAVWFGFCGYIAIIASIINWGD